MAAGECKLQETIIESGLSPEKLLNGETAYDFFVKVTTLLEAFDVYEWNGSFLCRRLISDTMGKYTGGSFLPGEQFVIISTFPVEGQVEVMILSKDSPGEEKAAAIRELARKIFAKEEGKPNLRVI